MGFNGFCKLLDRDIHEGTCVEIISELYGGKKEKEIEIIKKQRNLTNESVEKICISCPNYPE